MNRKFWISAVVMFVLASVLSYVAHEVLLKADYAKLGAMMRPAAEMQARLGYVVLAHVSFALAFTWIYIKGKERPPLAGAGRPLRHRDRVGRCSPDVPDLSRGHADAARRRDQADRL